MKILALLIALVSAQILSAQTPTLSRGEQKKVQKIVDGCSLGDLKTLEELMNNRISELTQNPNPAEIGSDDFTLLLPSPSNVAGGEKINELSNGLPQLQSANFESKTFQNGVKYSDFRNSFDDAVGLLETIVLVDSTSASFDVLGGKVEHLLYEDYTKLKLYASMDVITEEMASDINIMSEELDILQLDLSSGNNGIVDVDLYPVNSDGDTLQNHKVKYQVRKDPFSENTSVSAPARLESVLVGKRYLIRCYANYALVAEDLLTFIRPQDGSSVVKKQILVE
jgi:hypothetical protein